VILLHRLEQRRLRFRRRPINLVREQNIREDWPLDEADDALPGRAILFDDLGAKDVRRHEVGRELNAVEFQIDRFGELLDEQCLRESWNTAQQAMSAGEKRDQDLAHDALLADDGLGELVLEPAGHFGDALERHRRLRTGEAQSAISHAVGDSSLEYRPIDADYADRRGLRG
jgi:hypothetical protein